MGISATLKKFKQLWWKCISTKCFSKKCQSGLQSDSRPRSSRAVASTPGERRHYVLATYLTTYLTTVYRVPKNPGREFEDLGPVYGDSTTPEHCI